MLKAAVRMVEPRLLDFQDQEVLQQQALLRLTPDDAAHPVSLGPWRGSATTHAALWIPWADVCCRHHRATTGYISSYSMCEGFPVQVQAAQARCMAGTAEHGPMGGGWAPCLQLARLWLWRQGSPHHPTCCITQLRCATLTSFSRDEVRPTQLNTSPLLCGGSARWMGHGMCVKSPGLSPSKAFMVLECFVPVQTPAASIPTPPETLAKGT